MQAFNRLFPMRQKRPVLLGMIHLKALPGSPLHKDQKVSQIIDTALREAELLKKFRFDGLIVENMHDVPYVKHVGPEVIASMALACSEVKKTFEGPVGVQVLAGANKAALAIAKTSGLQFIRAEAFVYGHVADEGWMDAQAGDLLRYRQMINAEDIYVYTDIKKKHSAHSVTSDVSIGETASAASFFLSDGLIVTGSSTGAQANPDDALQVRKATPDLPVLIGSGITPGNVAKFANNSDAFIVGSYLKQQGMWNLEMDEERVEAMAAAVFNLDTHSS